MKILISCFQSQGCENLDLTHSNFLQNNYRRQSNWPMQE